MTIKEVAEKYDISADTLRYYERVGMIPKVTRKANGIRNYQESDLGWVELALCMRSAGLPVEVMIEYVKLYRRRQYHSSKTGAASGTDEFTERAEGTD